MLFIAEHEVFRGYSRAPRAKPMEWLLEVKRHLHFLQGRGGRVVNPVQIEHVGTHTPSIWGHVHTLQNMGSQSDLDSDGLICYAFWEIETGEQTWLYAVSLDEVLKTGTAHWRGTFGDLLRTGTWTIGFGTV